MAILLRVFDDFSDAQAARTLLLENGFATESVRLQSGEDEAGPLAGNFAVGNAHPEVSTIAKIIDKITGGDSHSYEGNYDNAVYTASHHLQVNILNEVERDKAVEIMKNLGGKDVEEKTPNS